MCAQARRRAPTVGEGGGSRSVTRSLSLRKLPLPPMRGNLRLREAPGGGLLNLPLLGQGGCRMALRPSACPPPRTGRPGSREEQGIGRGEDSLSGQGPARVLGGQTPPRYGVPRGGGGDRLWLLPGVRVGRGRRVRRWEWRLGGEDGPAGGLLVASGVRQGRGFRVEGEARSDPRWPALARCLAELARVALWLAPRLRVDLLRLLGRCTVLAERVFAAAEDWGTEEIVTRFLGVLGEMTEDAFESLAHLGTSPRPKKASISDEILRRGLGEMGACPIPREMWDELVPASLPERLRGVQLPEGKGYPSSETEVMMEVLKDQGVFDEVHVGQGERGGPNCTPFVIPKNDIKASLIMDCTPGNAADPEPPPHFFFLASWTALGEWLQVYGGGDLCFTHVDLSNAFWSFLLPAGSEGMFRFRFGGKL